MEDTAKLISAIAALIGAIAWPTAFFATVIIFRKPLREALGRVKKGKIGFVELELEQVAATAAKSSDSGEITAEQIHSAARIEVRSGDIGQQELLRQLDALCIEYDTVRRTMPPGPERTSTMTRILVQMRAIGPSVASSVDAYKSSGSPGSRLAAIAIMQMKPALADIPWLLDRFGNEAPFLFYHAALALQNVATAGDQEVRQRVQQAATKAIEIVRSFPGKPDSGTLSVLEPLART